MIQLILLMPTKQLYFVSLPKETMVFKGEKCFCGKFSTVRVSILLTTNMSGTVKLKPLLIGKAKKPRCFANCKSFLIDYKANIKAWMTADLFSEWIRNLDKKIGKEKREKNSLH